MPEKPLPGAAAPETSQTAKPQAQAQGKPQTQTQAIKNIKDFKDSKSPKDQGDKSEYVYLTRCIKDPVTQKVYPLGKYARKALPAIAFERGYAIAKSS